MRRELYYVALTFLLILFLPILSFVVFTNTGFSAVSNRLVATNPLNHTVQLLDPRTGKVIKEISAPMVWPIHGVVTLEFGQNDLPYQPYHTGIDIAGSINTPITPFMKGTVSEVGHVDWGYGNYVVIDHGNNITSLYGHMNQTNATKGESVQPGDIIGYVGQTGWATGPHVHFQIDVNGIPVNPRSFLGNVNP
jgi:murein DD-endopeptidase MepM/ murein hydrolase activator NlpD